MTIVERQQEELFKKIGKPDKLYTHVPKSEEELHALGLELLEFVSTYDPLHLSAFYLLKKGIVLKLWEDITQNKTFRPYYEIAKCMVGQKYLDGNSRIREGISHRWLRYYFPDLKKMEDKDHEKKLSRELEQKKQQMNHEMKLRIDSIKNLSDEDRAYICSIQEQITRAQLARNPCKVLDSASTIDKT